MHRQNTLPHGTVSALLTEMQAVLRPFRSLKSLHRQPPGCQTRKTASKATGAADMQASKRPSPSTMQTAEVLERDTAAQQGRPGVPERLSSSALLRRLTAVSTANEALDIFLQDGAAGQNPDSLQGFTEASPLHCARASCSSVPLLPASICLKLRACPSVRSGSPLTGCSPRSQCDCPSKRQLAELTGRTGDLPAVKECITCRRNAGR